jgi:hypothetical protein
LRGIWDEWLKYFPLLVGEVHALFLLPEGCKTEPLYPHFHIYEIASRLFVADVDHISDLSGGSPSHLEVLYETRIEYERQESSAQVIAMLDDIADAVWTLSDTKMPPEKKEHVRALVRELQGIVKSLPPGVAGGLAGEIAARFVDGN